MRRASAFAGRLPARRLTSAGSSGSAQTLPAGRQVTVEYCGGHPFDTVGEVPSEPAVSAAVVGFFVRTLLQDRPLARSA